MSETTCRYRGCGRAFAAPNRVVRYCSDDCRAAERALRGREYGARYYQRKAKERIAANAEWRRQNPDAARTYQLSKYGLTPQAFDSLLARQGGRCAICRSDTPGTKNWHVDHDHSCCPEPMRSCGKCVRGLLCRACNMALGAFRDSAATLRRAIEYLAGA